MYEVRTKESAAYKAKTNNRQSQPDGNLTRQETGQSSWYAERTPPGYGIFEQFRHGYESTVHLSSSIYALIGQA